MNVHWRAPALVHKVLLLKKKSKGNIKIDKVDLAGLANAFGDVDVDAPKPKAKRKSKLKAKNQIVLEAAVRKTKLQRSSHYSPQPREIPYKTRARQAQNVEKSSWTAALLLVLFAFGFKQKP